MPLKVPDAIRVTPAVSIGASDEDTSEFLDTEEIYAASRDATISEAQKEAQEAIIEAQKLAAKKLAAQLKKVEKAEKKLTLDDIEEFNRRISGASSRSASTVSENESTSGEESRKSIKKVSLLQDALKKAGQDQQDVSSEEEEPKESEATPEAPGDKELVSEKEEKSMLKEGGILFMKIY